MVEDADEVRLTLRLPARVRDHLIGKGRENGRSLNAEIVSRLERSVDFEDEYGVLEDLMKEIWTDIDELKTKVAEHEKHILPQAHRWK